MKINGYEIKPGVNLSGCDLSNQELDYCNLQGANLENAILTGCSLKGTNLKYSKLQGADLSNSNLEEADLTGCNLKYANLTNCNLIKCKMFNIEVYQTIFNEPSNILNNEKLDNLQQEIEELKKYKKFYEEFKSKMP